MPIPYSPQVQDKIDATLSEFRQHRLRSGRAGLIVRNRKQAIAIALSQARREGLPVPRRPVNRHH